MTKKASPSKAKTPIKKTAATKTASSKKLKKAPRLTWRFYAVTIGIFLVAVTTVLVMAYLAANMAYKQQNQARLDRINEIYAAIDLDNKDYVQREASVFGDKRTYEWDRGRSYSSFVRYTHGDTVSNTVAELDAKIKAAGFTYINEPYPGSVQVQYHYKSPNNEYIRLSVSSKPYDDAWVNAMAMKQKDVPASVYEMDKNAGPVNVTLKVNLDDNNE